MKHALPIALICLLSACHKAEAPVVGKAWVRLPAVAGQPGAGYFTISGGRRDAQLVRIESALVQKIELHESMGGAGMGAMATMQPLKDVTVPAGGTIIFAPGGKHAMLFGIDAGVKPGTAIPLRFGFADGTTTEAEAKTVPAAGDAPY